MISAEQMEKGKQAEMFEQMVQANLSQKVFQLMVSAANAETAFNLAKNQAEYAGADPQTEKKLAVALKEIERLGAELAKVTAERDSLKKPSRKPKSA